jgi:hypothetical protein
MMARQLTPATMAKGDNRDGKNKNVKKPKQDKKK